MKSFYNFANMRTLIKSLIICLLISGNTYAKEIGVIGFVIGNAYNQDGKKLNVDIGELFYFGRDTLHEITEVKSGIRYSLHFGIDKAKHLI